MKLLYSLILTLFLSSDVTPANLCNIVARNNLEIPFTLDSGITENEFNAVLDEFMKVNGPLAEQKGYKLVIKNLWKDKTVNASTTRSGSKWIINAYGGLARYEGMDPDTYMMVLCHELGHQLGGFPAKSWASNEGQSDYYATMKCFRRMSYSRKPSFDVPKIVKERCSVQHKSQDEITICENGSMIGAKLANILNSLSDSTKDIDFSTPDKKEVTSTDNSHPEAQCRLDTYFAGAVCGISYLEEFSKDNPVPGSCAEEKGDKFGVRPRCWYKPKSE